MTEADIFALVENRHLDLHIYAVLSEFVHILRSH